MNIHTQVMLFISNCLQKMCLLNKSLINHVPGSRRDLLHRFLHNDDFKLTVQECEQNNQCTASGDRVSLGPIRSNGGKKMNNY